MYYEGARPQSIRPGRNVALIVFGIVAIVLILSAVLLPILCRNQLIDLDTGCATQWQQVDNELERQSELLPKLVAVTKRYATYESSTLEKLATIQAKYAHASERDRPALASRLDGAMAQVLTLATGYPDLKADRQFRDLAFEIAGTKNRIAVERARYNAIVGYYNAHLQELPWKWFNQGLQPRKFYEPSPEALKEPELDL
jgi:LemA protein